VSERVVVLDGEVGGLEDGEAVGDMEELWRGIEAI